jgi:hypothetical protein
MEKKNADRASFKNQILINLRPDIKFTSDWLTILDLRRNKKISFIVVFLI